MSNIAAPRPTDEALRGEIVATVRTLLGAVLLTALLVTLTPFVTVPTGTGQQGNIVNQLGYGLLAAIALLGHLLFTDRRVVLSLLRPVWIVTILWYAVTTAQAVEPEGARRAYAFMVAAMIAATGVLCLPPTVRAFRFCLTVACATVLALSYFGVAALPEIGVHSFFGPEGHHGGLWRGVYSHKNIAGAMMAALFFAGIYLLRCRQWLTGGAIAGLSLLFVLQTGSRTAALLLPAVAVSIVGARLIGGKLLAAFGVAMLVFGLAALTIGLTVSPALQAALTPILPDPTLTGRTFLWAYAFDLSEGRRWLGFGLDSFWRAATVFASEPSRELAWDPRGAANGHSGYMDLLITSGIPGLVLGVLTLVVLPLVDYARAGSDRETVRLADLFLMILAFLLLNAFLESFFFERGSPIWMTLWIAVVGLRLVSVRRLSAG